MRSGTGFAGYVPRPNRKRVGDALRRPAPSSRPERDDHVVLTETSVPNPMSRIIGCSSSRRNRLDKSITTFYCCVAERSPINGTGRHASSSFVHMGRYTLQNLSDSWVLGAPEEYCELPRAFAPAARVRPLSSVRAPLYPSTLSWCSHDSSVQPLSAHMCQANWLSRSFGEAWLDPPARAGLVSPARGATAPRGR